MLSYLKIFVNTFCEKNFLDFFHEWCIIVLRGGING
nr:MAG TPA: hypothetical protein [Caudoviricetes sp.]